MHQERVVWHLPEQITFLYYSPVYATLSLGQKLAYNHLHASYFCEMCALLEQELPRYYLSAASGPGVPYKLLEEARGLAASEARHAVAFRSLARALSPRLYSSTECVFVRSPQGFARIVRALFEVPLFRPALLWIALIQEERGIFFGEEVLRQAEHIDSRVVAWHRRHLADEADHVSLGEALLPFYWTRTSPWLRRVNIDLLRFVLREFLSAPKRAGLRVIDYLVEECPMLQPRKAELLRAMRELDHNPVFHESLYSRRIVPKTFALFDRYEEFRDLGKSLRGYAPEIPQ